MKKRVHRAIRVEYPLAESLARKRFFAGPRFFVGTKYAPEEIRAALILTLDLAAGIGRQLKLSARERRLLAELFERTSAELLALKVVPDPLAGAVELPIGPDGS